MIKNEGIPWTKRAVFICTKCHKSFPAGTFSEEGNCGENLKNKLKAELKKEGLHKDIRVMTSSCLDVCEPQTQAVYIQELSSSECQMLTIDPTKDYLTLYEKIKG